MELALAAGSFIAANAGTFLSLAWTIGSGLIGGLLADPVKVKGPRLNDLRVSSSAYGLKLTQLYGTVRLNTNMIWSTGIQEKKKTTTTGGGFFGKGGSGGSQSLTTYSYSLTAAYGIGEPCDNYLRIWANKKVIADQRANVKLSKKYRNMEIRFYSGEEDQLPDPDMQAKDGVDFTPAYRGVSYVLIKNLPLEDFGNAPPQIEIEAVRSGDPVPHFVERLQSGVDGFSFYATGGLISDTKRMIYYGLLIPSNNQIGKFDSLGNRFLSSTDPAQNISGASAHDIDADGFPVALIVTGLGVRTPVRFDPITWQQLAIGDQEFGISFLRADRNSTLGNIWTCNGTALGDSTIRIFNKSLGYTIGVDTEGAGFGRVRSINAIDGDGNGWCMDTDGNLLKIEPSGAMTDFDLTAHYPASGLPPITAYDPTNNVILIYGSGVSDQRFVKIDPSDGSVISFAVVTPANYMIGQFRNDFDNGTFWYFIGPSSFVRFDIATMTTTRTVELADIDNPASNYLGVIYLPQTNSLLADWQVGLTDFGIDNIYLDRIEANPMLLSQVVDEISTGRPDVFLKGAGMEDSLVDVTALTDEVDGYFSAKLEPGRSLLEQLRMAYFFDGVESDGKVKFKKRGGVSVYTIPSSELAAHERGQELPDPVTTTRAQETELPRRVSITFFDKDKDYIEGVQYSGRLITEAVNEVNIELPIVLTNDHARQITEILMAEQWAARNIREIKLTNKYADLDAADPIEVAA